MSVNENKVKATEISAEMAKTLSAKPGPKVLARPSGMFPSRFTYIAAFVAYVVHGYAGY